MAAAASDRRNSNTQILQELEALSDTLYQSHTTNTNRRTASLALPRSTAIPSLIPSHDDDDDEPAAISTLNPKPRSRRMSLSPWRSRPKQELPIITTTTNNNNNPSSSKKKLTNSDEASSTTEKKKGFLSWKPIRALAHIGMQKLSCLFSVEVVTVQSLPTSMNGLRLSVCVRKKETKDGVVQTMPSRVSHGAADFEETLFIRCHVYYSTPGSGGTHMKFEPRPFLAYVVAVDADELDFGRSVVDLSSLIQESIDKSFEGTRIRQWDTSFILSGKAKGGELVLKLGFQIMEKDGGIGIYTRDQGKKSSPSFARKQSKSSFSVPSPRMTARAEAWTPSQKAVSDYQEMDDLNLDEPAPPQVASVETTKMDDGDLLEFDIVDKGVEKTTDQDKKDHEDEDLDEEERSEENSSDKRSVSSEVVKEVVQDQSHVTKRLTELDSIAQQIKALESMMGEENNIMVQKDEETASQTLDADEDKVTREFLQMLEGDGEDDNKLNEKIQLLKVENDVELEEEFDGFISDLGKGLGSVVQTRNGGYLAAMNPLDNVVARKDTPKLAMQLSKPLIIQSKESGFELFQKMAAIGLEGLTSEISSLMPMDELMGKTAEQIAFEGIASAIIQGRNKEGASSSAARTIAAVKSMANAMSSGRKERVSTGIWNVSETPVTVDEILAFTMQKIENMAIEAMKIEADMAEEDAPFDVSPIDAKTFGSNGKVYNHLFASSIPVEDWIKMNVESGGIVTICAIVQLRDPMRQYEAVGGPMIALIHATDEKCDGYNNNNNEEEKRYKVASLQVGGIKVKSLQVGTKNMWDSEKHRLTALQWLLAYGLGKKGKRVFSKGPDLLWSISSRIMADMWLKPIRNPDVKFFTK